MAGGGDGGGGETAPGDPDGPTSGEHPDKVRPEPGCNAAMQSGGMRILFFSFHVENDRGEERVFVRKKDARKRSRWEE